MKRIESKTLSKQFLSKIKGRGGNSQKSDPPPYEPGGEKDDKETRRG